MNYHRFPLMLFAAIFLFFTVLQALHTNADFYRKTDPYYQTRTPPTDNAPLVPNLDLNQQYNDTRPSDWPALVREIEPDSPPSTYLPDNRWTREGENK